MASERIGILHPGAMGISLAASAQNSGRQVAWASEGRSPATRDRASKLGLRDAGSLAVLCAECSVLVSVCPPHAAEAVARDVVACGFTGLYVDANAIAPRRAIQIGQAMAEAGITFVDGGIIGGPAWDPNRTWLYLAGPQADAMYFRSFSAGGMCVREHLPAAGRHPPRRPGRHPRVLRAVLPGVTPGQFRGRRAVCRCRPGRGALALCLGRWAGAGGPCPRRRYLSGPRRQSGREMFLCQGVTFRCPNTRSQSLWKL
jgi:hypothetical protein